MVAIIINLITIILLIYTILQDKTKAKKAVKSALVKFINLLPMMLVI